ncbi:MAG: flagellar basal body-associated FliL family protein [Deltaproteobacteria bacterium]|nr:flagellar basal body-associated FliL family protein [Deltaproteobacteria bacterium]
MAEEAKEEAAEKPAGGGKKKLIMIIVAVLVLVGGGAGAFFVMGGSGSEEGGEEGEEGEEHGEEEGAEGEHGELPGAIMPLETFIVNLQVKGSFLKTTINLEFADPELPHSAENDMPKIRDAVIRVLTKKEAKEILTPEGKDKMRDEIKETVNQSLGSEDVVGVFFSEFIVQ